MHSVELNRLMRYTRLGQICHLLRRLVASAAANCVLVLNLPQGLRLMEAARL